MPGSEPQPVVDRTENLLAELKCRFGIDEPFAQRLRPTVKRILDPALPDSARLQLLELLAETCERESTLRRETTRTQAALSAFSAQIDLLLRSLKEIRPPV